MKPILCLDFDGVLHSYVSGWQGAGRVSDAAVPGAAYFLEEAVEAFEVHIFSARSNQEGGIGAMKEWLALEFGHVLAEKLHFPTEKPPALVTLDDRAIQFMGTWPAISELLTFKPWNKLS